MDDFEVLVDASPTLIELVGRLHPMSTHLPIAATILLVLYELAAKLKLKGFEEAMPWHVVVAVLSYIPAALTGLIRLQEYADSETVNQGLQHGTLMVATLGVLIVFGFIRLTTRTASWWYLIGVSLALATMSAGAHLGGLMVFGEDYFG